MTYGATPLDGGGVQFRVWAPNAREVSVRVAELKYAMEQQGYDFIAVISEARAGQYYNFVLEGNQERPDPYSRSQPQGVHGPSEIVDPEVFPWSDLDWKGLALEKYIIYELHTGTFTPEGNFDGIAAKIPYLKELGVTAVELMPVAEFAGNRNWGYDGVDLFAPHSAYGGPKALKALVNTCHRAGIAVVLDVVYNHLGPEGNYLAEFGPYFTDRYRTPWGPAINYDGPGSDGVRRFVIDNALYWLTDYHIDALRLDAIHGIFDNGTTHILTELADCFHEQAGRLGRLAWLIAESDLNDVRVVQPGAVRGFGLDAQWHDEFHHAVISYLTKADRGFLGGFGNLAHLRKAIAEGFVYDGIYSRYRGRKFGTSSRDLSGRQFVVFTQNHDQVANTAQGLRLSEFVSPEYFKMAAAMLICSPYLPLLFMGEEFAETAPFLYFTSFPDANLARAVREGRRREYEAFAVSDIFEDPQDSATFEKSKIAWRLLDEASHAECFQFYRRLITLRKKWPCLSNCRKDLTRVEIDEGAKILRMERTDPAGSRALLVCNFATTESRVALPAPVSGWLLALYSGSVTDAIVAPGSVALWLSGKALL
jgi:maltooligosyltrehalose trehalohydrolase